MSYFPRVVVSNGVTITTTASAVTYDNSFAISQTNGQATVTGNTYRYYFDSSNLANGVLTVDHGLDEDYCFILVYNSNKEVVLPDLIKSQNANTVTIDFTSFAETMDGTWVVLCTK